MRRKASLAALPAVFLAIATGALGLTLSQPAAAWDDSHYRGSLYIHHHVYYPPRVKHVYHVHRPGARHVHVVHYADRPHDYYYSARGYPVHGYFGPRYYYRWRGYGWNW
ncbi:MAG: hypothetical protein F9K29_17470 [Hyphomicrobiaceae bacterium]|nr:MAG: hypothetical protein F9K29_17470 [Hyphomicrobiaceae bacterium]